ALAVKRQIWIQLHQLAFRHLHAFAQHHAAARIAFSIDLHEANRHTVLTYLAFFRDDIRDALRHAALLLRGAALYECDDYVWHGIRRSLICHSERAQPVRNLLAYFANSK